MATSEDELTPLGYVNPYFNLPIGPLAAFNADPSLLFPVTRTQPAGPRCFLPLRPGHGSLPVAGLPDHVAGRVLIHTQVMPDLKSGFLTLSCS